MAKQDKPLKTSGAASVGEHSVAKVGARILDLTCGYESYMWHDTATGLKLDTALYASRKVYENDIPCLVSIKREIIKATSHSHPKINVLRDIYLQWHRINQNVFRFIYDKSVIASGQGDRGQIIGFTSIIPLTNEGFQKYRSGQLSEWEFGQRSSPTGKCAIESSDSGPHKNLCIQSINLLPDYWYTLKARRYEPLESFLTTIVSHLSSLNPVPHKVPPSLIADGGSRGLHILESHGFLRILEAERAIDGLPIFDLDFARRSELPEKGRFVCDELEYLMDILGAALLIREHLDQNLGQVRLAFILWSRHEVAVGHPKWQLYLIDDRKHTRHTAKLPGLKQKLDAPLEFRAATVNEFQGMVQNNKLRAQLYDRQITIVTCADSELVKHILGDEGMPKDTDLAQLMNEPLPNDIKNDPFARAYLLDYYSNSKYKPFEGLYIACVLHFLRDLVPFFEALVRLGGDPARMIFFHKEYPYPQRQAVSEYLKKKGAYVLPLADLDDWLIQQEQKNDSEFIFVEDGGYITPRLIQDLHNLRGRTRLVVEQTTRGRRNIEASLKKLPESTKVAFPILSVASCGLKGVIEPPFIADSFEHRLKELLPDRLITGSRVGLIGFGSIGQAVADKLRKATAKVTVYAEDANHRWAAKMAGYEVAATCRDAIQDKEWIVGCTGSHIITKDEFFNLSDQSHLISCSSDQYEFDIEELEKIATRKENYKYGPNLVGRQYDLRGAKKQRIFLVADGYPLNFWGMNSMPDPLGDFIMAVLLLAARFGSGINPNGVDAVAVDQILDRAKIAEKFMARYQN